MSQGQGGSDEIYVKSLDSFVSFISFIITIDIFDSSGLELVHQISNTRESDKQKVDKFQWISAKYSECKCQLIEFHIKMDVLL